MAHLLVDDTGIDLRSFDIRMTEHFADRLDRYAIGKGNSGCESVSGKVEQNSQSKRQRRGKD